ARHVCRVNGACHVGDGRLAAYDHAIGGYPRHCWRRLTRSASGTGRSLAGTSAPPRGVPDSAEEAVLSSVTEGEADPGRGGQVPLGQADAGPAFAHQLADIACCHEEAPITTA